MKDYDLKFHLHAAVFFSYSEGGHRELKETLQQQLRMCQVERNQIYLPKIDGRSFCSKTLRVITNLKTKLMWRQSSPNYLRFWTAKSVTVERHATHSGRSLGSGGRNWDRNIDTLMSKHAVTSPETVNFKSSNCLPNKTVITDRRTRTRPLVKIWTWRQEILRQVYLVRDFKLPPGNRWEMCSSGLLRSK
jgi:hypothetical protein